MEKNVFKEWCKVELFGHSVIIGEVSEFSIGGETFIRVDVPECKGQAAFTKFYGKGAIYAFSPITKELALKLVDDWSMPPVSRYELPKLAEPVEPTLEPQYYKDAKEVAPDEEIF